MVSILLYYHFVNREFHLVYLYAKRARSHGQLLKSVAAFSDVVLIFYGKIKRVRDLHKSQTRFVVVCSL